MVGIIDENMVVWSTGDHLTAAPFGGVCVTKNCRIEIAYRYILSSVILKPICSFK